MARSTRTRPKGKLIPSEKETLKLEDQLQELQLDPPSDLDEHEAYIWTHELVPLIKLGVLKETDYSACVSYCELACYRIRDLNANRLSYLSKLRDQLGLTPAARMRVAPSAVAKQPDRIADVLKLHVV